MIRRSISQCIVVAIDAKKVLNNKWEVFTHGGRNKTGIDSVEFAKQVEDNGAGEILLTSIDQEGTSKGFDCELIESVTTAVDLPLLASGGFGSLDDIEKISKLDVDGLVIADAIHFNKIDLSLIREKAKKLGLKVRNF